MILLRLQSPADAASIAHDDFEWTPASRIAVETLDGNGSRFVPLDLAIPPPDVPRPVQTKPASRSPHQAPRRARWRRGASLAVALVLGGSAVAVSHAELGMAIDRLIVSTIAAPLPAIEPVSFPVPRLADIAPALLEAAAMDPLAPPARQRRRGTLVLNAFPWAQVWIDGLSIGDTPIASVEMAPGTHHVRFQHPEFGERHVIAVIEAGQRAQMTVDFRDAVPAPGC